MKRSTGSEHLLIVDDDVVSRTLSVKTLRHAGFQVSEAMNGEDALLQFAAHPHDLTTYADQYGLALRGGHHCNQPLMKKLGIASTARASFYFYNNRAEVDRFIEVVRGIQKFFAQ